MPRLQMNDLVIQMYDISRYYIIFTNYHNPLIYKIKYNEKITKFW